MVSAVMRRALLAALFLIGFTVTVNAACTTGSSTGAVLSWVNIKSCGAVGNGSTDDTAAIQAAIDYAFAHNLTAVYCPIGTYRTTSTIYLDPPGNLRSNYASPASSQFTMAFFGDPKGSGALPVASQPTCLIRSDFNNAVAFLVGPGYGMRVSDIGVVGPNVGYRGNYDPAGVGIGIAGGNGGASNTLIRDTFVRYFYSLYMTDANGGCCLSDSNDFDHVGGSDGANGILLWGTQSFINNINAPVFGGVTVAISNPFSHQTQVTGGNLSATQSASNAFAISGATAANCGGVSLCLTATITTPDDNLPNVYDSFEMLTAHFGLVPFAMTAWNPSTHVISLKAPDVWERTNYGANSYWYNNDLFAELDEVTTLYASERLRVLMGVGFELDGTHVENNIACTTLYDSKNGWAGQLSTKISNPYFNYEYSIPQDATQANKYCQQAWPFIDNTTNPGTLKLSGGNWGATNPVIFDITSSSSAVANMVTGEHLGGNLIFNVRMYDTPGYAYGQVDQGLNGFDTVAHGTGLWDNAYFFPSKSTAWQHGELTSPFCGYEPCGGATPNLSASVYALVSGSLGALGTYPPIACRTLFKSLDWDTAARVPGVGGPLGGMFLRSASCPGWSWGQNLTDASVGHTVTWSYKRGSSDLYLDANTIKWMFPGQGFTLNNGEGAQPYVVTGVYPYLGYISVIWAGNNSGNSGGNSVGLQGGTNQVYSCSSSCTIGQAAFAWTAY